MLERARAARRPRRLVVFSEAVRVRGRVRGKLLYRSIFMMETQNRGRWGSVQRPDSERERAGATMAAAALLLLPQAALLGTKLLGASDDEPLQCTVEPGLARCFADGPAARLFANDFVASSAEITPELCASICFRAGLPLAGVEAGGECHCGTGFNSSVPKVALNASRCHAPCAGRANSTCGGNGALDVLAFSCVGHAVPNYKGCENAVSRALPYCDTSLSVDERLSWLLGNLSLAEKIATISPQRALGDTCGTHTAGKASIGLPDYFWLTETNSAVFSTCLGQPWRCPTTFIGPLGMGASFNRTSWKQKGGVLGRELRAFYNLAWQDGWRTDRVALTAFGPNINIARDRTKVTICLHTTRSPKRAPAQNLTGCVTFRSKVWAFFRAAFRRSAAEWRVRVSYGFGDAGKRRGWAPTCSRLSEALYQLQPRGGARPQQLQHFGV